MYRWRRHPCGCTSPQEELDPRHIIHYDSTKELPPLDTEKAGVAEKALARARAAHQAASKRPPKEALAALEEVRKAYKAAALAAAEAYDVMTAVLADTMDSIIDYEIAMLEEENG